MRTQKYGILVLVSNFFAHNWDGVSQNRTQIWPFCLFQEIC